MLVEYEKREKKTQTNKEIKKPAQNKTFRL